MNVMRRMELEGAAEAEAAAKRRSPVGCISWVEVVFDGLTQGRRCGQDTIDGLFCKNHCHLVTGTGTVPDDSLRSRPSCTTSGCREPATKDGLCHSCNMKKAGPKT